MGIILTPWHHKNMKVLGNAEEKLVKGKNGKNVSQLENIVVVLVQCNIVNNKYQRDSRVVSAFG